MFTLHHHPNRLPALPPSPVLYRFYPAPSMSGPCAPRAHTSVEKRLEVERRIEAKQIRVERTTDSGTRRRVVKTVILCLRGQRRIKGILKASTNFASAQSASEQDELSRRTSDADDSFHDVSLGGSPGGGGGGGGENKLAMVLPPNIQHVVGGGRLGGRTKRVRWVETPPMPWWKHVWRPTEDASDLKFVDAWEQMIVGPLTYEVWATPFRLALGEPGQGRIYTRPSVP